MMIVRQLTAHDATAYQTLRLRGLQECPTAFSASYADEASRSPAEVATRVTPAPDGSVCVFGAFLGDQLAGILAFIRPQRAKLRHAAALAGLYVAPEFRRRSLGRALVDAALAHARSLPGVRQLKLTVNATNVPARALYQSRGFTRWGVEPEALGVEGDYYDEELYVLRLSEGAEPGAAAGPPPD
jgi:ribosomal protein S18 acetylase RimI-like enzyme